MGDLTRRGRATLWGVALGALLLGGCPQKDNKEQRPAAPGAPAAARGSSPAKASGAPSQPGASSRPRTPLPAARPAFARLQAEGKESSLSDVAEQAVRSVVNISSTRVTERGPAGPLGPRYPFPGQPRRRRARSLGSGVIVDKAGVVLTNNHVVARTKDIRVTLSTGQELSARLVGADDKSDLAVLRLTNPPEDLQPMPLGRSGKLRLGEVVLAIGNPFGVGQTVTMGIVSAVGRANMGIVDYEDFIQTDAAINPGNSGGALVNMRGELIGINTAILSRTGGYQGIGFSIPTDMARPIMTSLLEHGRVVRGWLGVSIQELSPELAQAMGRGTTRGILVVEVEPDSPAARAGLRRDDVIVKLDGAPMDQVVRLRNRVASTSPGSEVSLTVRRGDKTVEVSLTLGELPGSEVAELNPSSGSLGGLTVKTLDDETRTRLGLSPRVRGVVVSRVEWGSAAEAAGLKEGDLIVEFDRRPVPDAGTFARLYRGASGKLLLLVLRKGNTMYLILEK